MEESMDSYEDDIRITRCNIESLGATLTRRLKRKKVLISDVSGGRLRGDEIEGRIIEVTVDELKKITLDFLPTGVNEVDMITYEFDVDITYVDLSQTKTVLFHWGDIAKLYLLILLCD